jgi:hypothetical protein
MQFDHNDGPKVLGHERWTHSRISWESGMREASGLCAKAAWLTSIASETSNFGRKNTIFDLRSDFAHENFQNSNEQQALLASL